MTEHNLYSASVRSVPLYMRKDLAMTSLHFYGDAANLHYVSKNSGIFVKISVMVKILAAERGVYY